jgi:putative transposase
MFIPCLSVSSIVRKLKQESTKQIWSLYSDVLSQEFWSDGYFACSIGEALPDTIREYILNQG